MGSNPTPSAREQGSRRRGWAFEPGVEPPVLRILGSPSARFAGPRLRIPLDRAGGLQHRIVALARTLRRRAFLLSGFAKVDGLRPCMFGRVAEWLKAHDWKSCGLTPTWVRIPPRPLAGEARHRAAWASNPGLSLRRFVSSAHLRRRWRGARLRIPPRGGGAPRGSGRPTPVGAVTNPLIRRGWPPCWGAGGGRQLCIAACWRQRLSGRGSVR